MSQELLYTSAPKGLRPGSRGFCTVVTTHGMSAPMAAALESLSAYRSVYPAGDSRASQNPVVWSHVKLPATGKTCHVLSRVSDYGLDYSQRSNKLAHHVVLEPAERPLAGPAWLLSQPGFMQVDWDGEPRVLPAGRAVKRGDQRPGVCTNWQLLTGDAGWAGVLAEAFLNDPARPVYILFEPGMDLLPLFTEAISLLPADRRWEVTFSTYFTNLPPAAVCNWRCVLADSPEAQQSRRFVHALRIDLCAPLPAASGGELVELARTGRHVSGAAATPPAAAVPASLSETSLLEQLELDSVTDDIDDLLEAEVQAPRTPPVPELPRHEPPSVVPATHGADQGGYSPELPLSRGAPPVPRSREKIEAMYAEDNRRISGLRLTLIISILSFLVIAAALAITPLLPRLTDRSSPSVGAQLVNELTNFEKTNKDLEIAKKPDNIPTTAPETERQPTKPPAQKDVSMTAAADSPSQKQPTADQTPASESPAPATSTEPTDADKSHPPATTPTPATPATPAPSTTPAGPAAAPAPPSPDDRSIKEGDLRVRLDANDVPVDSTPIYIEAKQTNVLEISVAESSPVSWSFFLPPIGDYRLKTDESNRKFRIQTKGANPSGNFGTVSTIHQPNPESFRGNPEVEPRRKYLEIYFGSKSQSNGRKGAQFDAFRWGAIRINTAAPAESRYVALTGKPQTPTERHFDEGKIQWKIDAWGGSVPNLLLDITLKINQWEVGTSRQTITGVAQLISLKGTAVGREEPWLTIVDPPHLSVMHVADKSAKGKYTIVLNASDLSFVDNKKDALTRKLTQIQTSCNKLEVILDRDTSPARFEFTFLKTYSKPANGESETKFNQVIAKCKSKADQFRHDRKHDDLTKVETLMKDVKDIDSVARTVVAAEAAFKSAVISSARVYYEVIWPDSPKPLEVDLIRIGPDDHAK